MKGFVIRVDDELSLRLHEPCYADEVYNAVIANRDHIARWMPWLSESYSLESSRQYAADSLRAFAERKSMTVTLLENGRVVGSGGWTDWKQVKMFDGRLEFASADIGYWLAVDAQGRGLMTRAVRALTTLGFETYGLHRLTIRAEEANVRSWSVAERLGYKLEGVMRDVSRFDGRPVHHRLYALLADEWRG